MNIIGGNCIGHTFKCDMIVAASATLAVTLGAPCKVVLQNSASIASDLSSFYYGLSCSVINSQAPS